MSETIKWVELPSPQQKILEICVANLYRAWTPVCTVEVAGVGWFSNITEKNLEEKDIVVGTNTQTANMRSCCGEGQCIKEALSKGRFNLHTIGVVARPFEIDAENEKLIYSVAKKPLFPCGDCLQRLAECKEISGNDVVIITANHDFSCIRRARLSELITEPFLYGDIGIDIKLYAKIKTQQHQQQAST